MDNQLPTIYAARHGDTAWSISGQDTGLTDPPLTFQGEDHARRLRGGLEDIVFATVLTTPLQRARKKYEGPRSTEIHAERPDWDLFRDGAPGGKGPSQVAERAANVWTRVRSMTWNVILFSSGHFIRVLAARWIGLEPSWHCNSFVLGTASLSVFGYDSVLSRPVIQLWNDMHHVSAA